MILLAKIKLELFDKLADPWGGGSLFEQVAVVFWVCAILYFLLRIVLWIFEKTGWLNDPEYKFEKYWDKYFGVPLLVFFGLLVIVVLISGEYRGGGGKFYDDVYGQAAGSGIE